MVKLNTIQKKNNLNTVFLADEKGAGGANHCYIIKPVKEKECKKEQCTKIQFQNGARNTAGSKSGVIDSDLLEIVRHRLTCFQKGDFNSEYNKEALLHVEKALMALNKRVEDRDKRNVLGTNKK